jgi:hypothetical protein
MWKWSRRSGGELVEIGLEELDEQAVGTFRRRVASAGLVADVGDRHAHLAEPVDQGSSVCTPNPSRQKAIVASRSVAMRCG